MCVRCPLHHRLLLILLLLGVLCCCLCLQQVLDELVLGGQQLSLCVQLLLLGGLVGLQRSDLRLQQLQLRVLGSAGSLQLSLCVWGQAGRGQGRKEKWDGDVGTRCWN
jgi:hypothetical protein